MRSGRSRTLQAPVEITQFNENLDPGTCSKMRSKKTKSLRPRQNLQIIIKRNRMMEVAKLTTEPAKYSRAIDLWQFTTHIRLVWATGQSDLSQSKVVN